MSEDIKSATKENSSKTRRPQGEGTLTQNPNGTWTIRKRYGRKPDGKPLIKKFTGKTKTEARNKRLEYERQMLLGNTSPSSVDFVNYMRHWAKLYKINTVKGSTYDAIENCIESRIKNYGIASMPLNCLNTEELQKYINELVKAKYSHATIQKTYNTINNCLTQAVNNGDLVKNPLAGVKLPSPDRVLTAEKEIEFFDESDIKKIFDEAQRVFENGKPVYQYGYAIIFLMYTGLRVGEAIALKWKDIDFDAKTVSVNRTASMIKNRKDRPIEEGQIVVKADKYLMVITTPKTKSSIRRLRLTKKAKLALEQLLELDKPFINEDDYVIQTNTHKIANRYNIARALRIVESNAKTEKRCGVHSLRHTFASMLFRKNIDVKVISKLLGHSKVTTTYNRYIHLIQEQEVDAMKVLDDL